MSGRPWTTKEVEAFAKLARFRDDAELMRLFNRSRRSVEQRRRKLGIRRQGWTRVTPALVERVRGLHACGWSREDIALELGCCDVTVCRVCTRLGLGSNAGSERHGEKIRAGLRERLDEDGLDNLIDLRLAARRARAMRAGWPADCGGLPHRILDALEQGPATVAQLAARMGIRPKRHLQLPGGGSAMDWMIGRGYAVRVGKTAGPSGEVRAYLYALAPGFARKLPSAHPFARYAPSTDEEPSRLKVG